MYFTGCVLMWELRHNPSANRPPPSVIRASKLRGSSCLKKPLRLTTHASQSIHPDCRIKRHF